MPRWLVHKAVALALLCVTANAYCFAQCVITSCGLRSTPASQGSDHSCHHKKPAVPGTGTNSCEHPQLSPAEWQETAAGFSDSSFIQALEGPVSFYVYETHLAATALPADLSPPLAASISSNSILRI